MNYIYILIVTLFTVALIVQMLAFAASSKKKMVEVEKSRNKQA